MSSTSDRRIPGIQNWSLWRRVARALAQVLACLAHWDARPAGGGADAGDRREQGVLPEVVGLTAMALTEGLSLMQAWWAAPLGRAAGLGAPASPPHPGPVHPAAPEHVAATIHAGRAACICMRQLCDRSDSARPGERTIHTEPGHYERIDRRRRVFIGTSLIGRDLREVDGHGESAGARPWSWRGPADGRHPWLGVALAEQVGTDPQEHGGVDQCHTELRPRRPQVRVVLADGH